MDGRPTGVRSGVPTRRTKDERPVSREEFKNLLGPRVDGNPETFITRERTLRKKWINQEEKPVEKESLRTGLLGLLRVGK